MNEKRVPPWSEFQVLLLAFCLLGAIGVFHLANAVHGRSFYRDIHLGTALEYAKTGIDLLHPVIVGFNATQTPTPQELPAWQAVAGLGFKLLGPWFGWANLISLLLFSTCLFPLYQLARTFYGSRCACWTLVFFLAEPLVFVYAGLASTDGFSIAAAIWFLYFAVRLLQKPGWKWWLLASSTGALAAVSKLPFFMAAGLAAFFLTLLYHRTSLRAWLWMGGVAAMSGLAFVAWTHHANRCLDQAEFPFVTLRASSPNMVFWYFGDWHYRLSPGNWIKGGWRVLNACFGSFALVGLFLTSLLFLGRHAFAKLWLAGGVLTTLVFSHLVLHHWHYYLMLTPAVALLCAQAAVATEKHLSLDGAWQGRAALGVVLLVLFLSVGSGLVGMKTGLLNDPFPREMAKLVQQHTHETDKLLIEGGGWGGDVLFLAHRQGMSIWDTKLLEKPETCRRLKELGYTKLVMISESPLQMAYRATNFGESGMSRQTYRDYLGQVAANYPTILENEDIVIKELP